MRDIERQLRTLGEKTRDEQQARRGLTGQALRRIRLRRLGVSATAWAVVGALGIGGTYALGGLDREGSRIPPAEDHSSDGAPGVLYSHFGARARAVIELNAAAGTVCYSLSSVQGYGTFTRVQIVEGLEEKMPVILGPPPYEGRTPLPGSTECVGNVEPSIIESVVESPDRYFLLIEDPKYGERVSSLTRGQKVDAPNCGPPVDFEPTYLPDEWVKALQPGEGGGGEFRGIVGHYGNDAPPGTTQKARVGFSDLIEGESPYPLTGGEEIRVLDEPALLGEIHEGFSVEFAQHDCDYFLIAFGISRDEFRRFAEGLRLPGEFAPAEPGDESFGGIWPEDTAQEANNACNEVPAIESWRTEALRAAKEFGRQVLGWEPAALVRLEEGRRVDVELRRSGSDDGAKADGPAVIVYMTEVFDDCWSVGSVSRLPDNKPTGASVGVTGRDVHIGFDDLGAESAVIEVGYGGQIVTEDWMEGEETVVALRLDFDPDTTGHWWVLFQDADGRVFSATGGNLPVGDFSAG